MNNLPNGFKLVKQMLGLKLIVYVAAGDIILIGIHMIKKFIKEKEVQCRSGTSWALLGLKALHTSLLEVFCL